MSDSIPLPPADSEPDSYPLGAPIRKPTPEPQDRPHPTNPHVVIGPDGKWRTVLPEPQK